MIGTPVVLRDGPLDGLTAHIEPAEKSGVWIMLRKRPRQSRRYALYVPTQDLEREVPVWGWVCNGLYKDTQEEIINAELPEQRTEEER